MRRRHAPDDVEASGHQNVILAGYSHGRSLSEPQPQRQGSSCRPGVGAWIVNLQVGKRRGTRTIQAPEQVDLAADVGCRGRPGCDREAGLGRVAVGRGVISNVRRLGGTAGVEAAQDVNVSSAVARRDRILPALGAGQAGNRRPGVGGRVKFVGVGHKSTVADACEAVHDVAYGSRPLVHDVDRIGCLGGPRIGPSARGGSRRGRDGGRMCRGGRGWSAGRRRRGRRSRAAREPEAAYARLPVVLAGHRIVFVGVPEGAIVGWVYR